ncbi:MAG: phasin family protein [Candidatus Latescibacteria bacterium]|nr:phasin family protein [Candidatus Latescibacterota bacterium]
MFELIQKTILAGIGAATMTKEKVEGLADALVKRGEVTSEQRPKIVQDLLARVEESERVLEEKVQKSVENTIERLGIPTKAGLDALNEKMDRLTKKVDEMGKTTAKS